MRLCFDMDGTIANLYSVENWLEMLMNSDETPYKIAKTLVNMNILAKYLNILQKKGYEIGIISWLAKTNDTEYHKKVTKAKKNWLGKHLKSVKFDFLEIVPYGTDKNIVCTSDKDILFDDEKHNRETWNGKAFDVDNILGTLKGLIAQGAQFAASQLTERAGPLQYQSQ